MLCAVKRILEKLAISIRGFNIIPSSRSTSSNLNEIFDRKNKYINYMHTHLMVLKETA